MSQRISELANSILKQDLQRISKYKTPRGIRYYDSCPMRCDCGAPAVVVVMSPVQYNIEYLCKCCYGSLQEAVSANHDTIARTMQSMIDHTFDMNRISTKGWWYKCWWCESSVLLHCYQLCQTRSAESTSLLICEFCIVPTIIQIHIQRYYLLSLIAGRSLQLPELQNYCLLMFVLAILP